MAGQKAIIAQWAIKFNHFRIGGKSLGADKGSADEILHKMRMDFSFYAARALRIRTKHAGMQPFLFNRAQRYLHQRVEEQLRRTGRVRILALKGRQQGISTYWEGRFYWRASTQFGKRVFILTHEDAATANLFQMAQRFHRNVPPELRPHTAAANAKELYFDRLDSGYSVATARTKGSGRSTTAQYFHGSEVAHWPNQADHMAGVMQGVPKGEASIGTEIALETTAAGIGEQFHTMWQAAERGHEEQEEGVVYEPVFLPWFWQEEYREPVPKGFQLTPEEAEYQALWDLDLEQMVFRRNTIETDFKGDEAWFRQEYPAHPSEAFQSGST